MQYILVSRMSLPRVSELITGDRNPAFIFLFPLNDAFALVKGWDYPSYERTAQPLPPFLAHKFTLSFCLCVFTERPGLFNYRFSAQSLLTGLYVRQNVGTKPDHR